GTGPLAFPTVWGTAAAGQLPATNSTRPMRGIRFIFPSLCCASEICRGVNENLTQRSAELCVRFRIELVWECIGDNRLGRVGRSRITGRTTRSVLPGIACSRKRYPNSLEQLPCLCS